MCMNYRQNLLSMLQTCKSLKRTQLLHQRVIILGLQSDHYLCKCLINLYLSFHLFEPAHLVLKTSQGPFHVSLWNGLLAACSKNHLYKESLNLFNILQVSSFSLVPNCYTFPGALKACGGLGDAEQGRKIHAYVLKSGFVFDVFISSSLVGMYAKCSLFDSAIRLFNEMSVRDVPCWNTVISCYYQDGQASEALALFKRMRNCGFMPDSVTYTIVFSACSRLSDLEMGRKLHEELIRSGFQLDDFISAAIVDMYGKCGCLESARDVFEQIPIKCVVSWNSIIGGYASNSNIKTCLELFSRMCEQGLRPTSTTISSLLMACSRTFNLHHGKFVHGYVLRNNITVDTFVYSALVDVYFKCNQVGYAESIFKEMPKANIVSWNVMISGYVSVGNYFKAIDIFHYMRKVGVIPDIVSFASALSACSQLAALEKGKEIHSYIFELKLESSEVVMSAVLDMYAKCGAVQEARQVFDRLPFKDVVSWTSMIMAYGSHGQALEAMHLFNELKKSTVKPDHVTFLAVISACAHGGLVDEGYHYFNQMIGEFGIKPRPEHYACLIDLLGRAGRLREAYNILQGTPSIKTDVGLLGSLFFACSMHKNFELGEEIAGVLMNLDPDDHSTYVSLANMYASVGRWMDARMVRSKMKQRGLKKNPGCSWIEVDKLIHEFFVEDDSHPLIDVIYECLGSLVKHMERDKKYLRIEEKSDRISRGRQCQSAFLVPFELA